jgi:putative ABC transport system permease protein
MKALRQIVAITWINLASLRQRLGSSVVIVIGIGGVVAVLTGVLAMASGMTETLNRATRPDRVIVMSGGAPSEVTSLLTEDTARTIVEAAPVRRDSDDVPLASFDVLRPIKVNKVSDGSEASAVLRGVSDKWQRVRPEIRIVAGRQFHAAVAEAIVGSALAGRFKHLRIGDQISAAGVTWKVVGIFTSNGDAHESEILADAATVISAYQRVGYNSLTVTLKSPGQLQEFERVLNANPALHVSVTREAEYYARQSQTMTALISGVAYGIGSIMAIGALFAALNTMYAAVSTRSREIATLRAVGYGPAAMVVSVLVEALLLALIGAVIGVFVAWWFVRNTTASTVAGDWGAQFVFGIAVTPATMLVGIAWAACIGLIGGLLPATRAARLPVATALRAL